MKINFVKSALIHWFFSGFLFPFISTLILWVILLTVFGMESAKDHLFSEQIIAFIIILIGIVTGGTISNLILKRRTIESELAFTILSVALFVVLSGFLLSSQVSVYPSEKFVFIISYVIFSVIYFIFAEKSINNSSVDKF